MNVRRAGSLLASAVLLLGLVPAAGAASAPAARPHVGSLSQRTLYSPGSDGNLFLKVLGHGFDHVKAVMFGATRAPSFDVRNPKRLLVAVPEHRAGVVHVRVVTQTGESSANDASRLTFLAAPTVVSLSPNLGSMAGGTKVKLTGWYLKGVTQVLFNSQPAKTLDHSAHAITVRTPNSTRGGAVVVDLVTRQQTWDAGERFGYLYSPPPAVTAVTPGHGDISGRRDVILSGRFHGVRKVWFGNTLAPSWQYVDPYGEPLHPTGLRNQRRLAVVAPAHSAGVVHVRVVTDGGSSTHLHSSRTAFRYADDGKPAIVGTNLPAATVGVQYWGLLRTGDDRAGTWRVVDGLPHGLSLAGDVVSGVPTGAGKRSVKVRFTDRRGRSDTATLHLVTAAASWTTGTHPADTACDGIGGCYKASSTYDDSGLGNNPPFFQSRTESSPAWQDVDLGAPSDGGWNDDRVDTVDCADDSGQCALMGVNYVNTDDGDPQTFISTPQDDGSWRSDVAPLPAGVQTFVALTAVSCEAQLCTAVGEGDPDSGTSPGYGTPVVERLVDGTWQATSISPAPLTGASLAAVDCQADGRCVATGTGLTAAGDHVPVAMAVAADGTATEVTVLPTPAKSTRKITLDSVSCAEAASCVAVGHSDADGTSYYESLDENGWHEHAFPALARLHATSMTLEGVDCGAASTCYSVGSAMIGGIERPLVAHISGTVAGTFVPHLPAGDADSGVLSKIACGSDGSCLAGGTIRYLDYQGKPGLVIAALGTTTATTDVMQTPNSSPQVPLRLPQVFGVLACGSTCIGGAFEPNFGGLELIPITHP